MGLSFPFQTRHFLFFFKKKKSYAYKPGTLQFRIMYPATLILFFFFGLLRTETKRNHINKKKKGLFQNS